MARYRARASKVNGHRFSFPASNQVGSGEEGERLRITPLTIFCPPPSCQKIGLEADIGLSAHSLGHFSLFSKTKPPPKSCQSPSNALSCERYTASLECASAVAFAISCILSPYTMAPHAAARSGLPARRQKKRTMIFPFSLIKVIRSLSLYSFLHNRFHTRNNYCVLQPAVSGSLPPLYQQGACDSSWR